MSQQKVNRYKEEKLNRQKIEKKKKLIFRLEILAVIVVLGALLTWFGVSVYRQQKARQDALASIDRHTTYLDLSEAEAYINDIAFNR